MPSMRAVLEARRKAATVRGEELQAELERVRAALAEAEEVLRHRIIGLEQYLEAPAEADAPAEVAAAPAPHTAVPRRPAGRRGALSSCLQDGRLSGWRVWWGGSRHPGVRPWWAWRHRWSGPRWQSWSSDFSTLRRLSEKRKHRHMQGEMPSIGYRCSWYDGGALSTDVPHMTNQKITPPGQPT